MGQPQTSTSLSGTTPARMKLGDVVRGRRPQPKRILLYGVEGVGKSSFAAGAPAPIFLGAEDGTSELDVERLPLAVDWQDVLDAVHVLTYEKHSYRTLVVDTVDWAEPMLWKHICKRDDQQSIEAYGYGKGYTAALDEWRFFLQRVDKLRADREMNIILLAHSWIKPFKNPEGEDFDRYELKLNPKASGVLKEWVDAVLFANYEQFARKGESQKRKILGLATGARWIYTERRAAYDAKNRYGLPPRLPLSWDDFAAAAAARQPEDPAAMKKRATDLIAQMPEAKRAVANAALTAAGDDAGKLANVLNRVNATIQALTPPAEDAGKKGDA